jgi:hypothetical protein
MRISTDPIDPAFDPLRARIATVYLNGERLDHVVTADEERGLVLKVAIDFHGRPVNDGDGPKIVNRRGFVRIELGGDDATGLLFLRAA